MIYKIIVTPDALQNIDDALYYYKNKVSKKVAKNFIDDYKQTFKIILKNPFFQIFFQDFRAKTMAKFPYVIFYTVDENLKIVIIKAVFHTLQNPNKYPLL